MPCTTEFHHELESVRGLLHRHGERLAGRPVFAPRVRLTIPEDAGDPWEVTLEVYDELDPGRWCSADDVWTGSALALDLAREERHLPRMEAIVTDTSEVVEVAPGPAPEGKSWVRWVSLAIIAAIVGWLAVRGFR